MNIDYEIMHAAIKILDRRSKQIDERDDELYHYGRKGMKWGEDIFAEDEESRRRRAGAQNEETGAQRAARLKKELLLRRANKAAEKEGKSPYTQSGYSNNEYTKQEMYKKAHKKATDILYSKDASNDLSRFARRDNEAVSAARRAGHNSLGEHAASNFRTNVENAKDIKSLGLSAVNYYDYLNSVDRNIGDQERHVLDEKVHELGYNGWGIRDENTPSMGIVIYRDSDWDLENPEPSIRIQKDGYISDKYGEITKNESKETKKQISQLKSKLTDYSVDRVGSTVLKNLENDRMFNQWLRTRDPFQKELVYQNALKKMNDDIDRRFTGVPEDDPDALQIKTRCKILAKNELDNTLKNIEDGHLLIENKEYETVEPETVEPETNIFERILKGKKG